MSSLPLGINPPQRVQERARFPLSPEQHLQLLCFKYGLKLVANAGKPGEAERFVANTFEQQGFVNIEPQATRPRILALPGYEEDKAIKKEDLEWIIQNINDVSVNEKYPELYLVEAGTPFRGRQRIT